MARINSKIRTYRILLDGIPIADKLSLEIALMLIKTMCNEWNKDTFSITLEQRQAIVELDKESNDEQK